MSKEEIKELEDLKRNLYEGRFNRSYFVQEQWLNSINKLQQENQQLSNELRIKNEELRIKGKALDEIREYCKFGIKEWITDDGFVEEVLGDILQILDEVKE
jgi:hypothetical protein